MCDVCARTEICTCCRTMNVLMVRVQNYECVACAGTGAATTHTERDIENSFPGTQMFAQARNNEFKYNNGTKNVVSNHYPRS